MNESYLVTFTTFTRYKFECNIRSIRACCFIRKLYIYIYIGRNGILMKRNVQMSYSWRPVSSKTSETFRNWLDSYPKHQKRNSSYIYFVLSSTIKTFPSLSSLFYARDLVFLEVHKLFHIYIYKFYTETE